MLDSEEAVLSLDNLFYDGPVIHKVKPLCQGQGAWIFDAPPSLSQIPATRDIQGEAANVPSFSYSQRSKKFLAPAQKPFHNPNESVQGQTVKSHELEESDLWTHEPSKERNQAVSMMGFVESRPLPTASAPPFKTRLFRAPTRRISGNGEDGISNQMMSTTNDTGFFGQVAMTTSGPQTTHGVATCSPFIGLGQTEQKCDVPAKINHNLHLGFKPAEFEGSSGKGTLRSVSEIPAKFRSVFKEFPYFNYVQSRALDDVLYTDKNFVACAPTGSGKTVLFELAIVRLLIESSEPWHNVRAVYMAPIKALCSQRYENWKQKFGPLGLNCKELTGDTEIDDIFEIQDAHLIFTTPEKWDSMTRRWKDNCLLPSVRLFLIDEVHVVKDKTRGATLEVVVSRMKTMHSYHLAVNTESKASVRFVAVSATIPNIRDLSEWLSDESGPATCLEMDDSHRPVKLRKVVLGFPCGSNQNEFKFDLSLNYKISNVIQTYSDQKPTLVFCSTRKGVQQSAAVLAKDARFIMSIDHKQRLVKYANSLLDAKLRDLFICGIGYHHAGMDVSDRKLIEEAFTVGDLPVLFTTSTLAMGVNLPAHLVIIKSTLHYVGGACEEYSEADLLQMIGRAGRPQIEMISKGKEFSDVQLRVNEKKTLNMLNKDKNRTTIRFPMEGKIKSNDMKVNCLIQAQLGCIPIQEFGLIQDTGKIFRNGNRVSRYLTEFLSHHSKLNFSAQLNSLILAKCFRAKLWENSPYVSRQLERIGLTLATAMVNAGLTTFSKIELKSPRELELILNRHPPFGNQIKEAVSKLPKYEVSLEQIPRYSLSTAEIVVTVNLQNFKELASKQTGPDHHYVTLIIGDCDNNVVFHQKIMDTLLLRSGSWSKRIEVTRTPKGEELSIHLISSEYVGLDIQQEYSAYYSGAKMFGAESCISERPTWRVQRILDTAKRQGPMSTTPSSSNTDILFMDQVAPNTVKRQCNHLCKNKELCGHECCKVGVTKRAQSSVTSYLNNLKMRNERISVTPVKRLKMMMNKGTAAVSMQQFSYKPKDTLPAAKKFQGSQCYTQSTYEIKELEANSVTPRENSSFESYHDGFKHKQGDFYSEIGDPALEHPQPSALPQRVSIHRQREPHNDGQMHRVSPKEASVYSTHTNPDHSTDIDDRWSGSLDVTFDLGLNDWDDFDDGNLVDASEVCCESQICNLMTDHDQPTNSASQCPGQTLQVLQQRIQPMAVTPQTAVYLKGVSMNSNQSQAKTPSVQRRFDFFSRADAALKENTVCRDHTEEINNETSVFLGMFDGLF
ncbi:probable ATP-dependent DNA helicase HFM1 isoform X2 [Megalobrama amblycephala]|uniref:probable ATP-dependent DNA helicase HFM1 isoform X2 n=1 Tax=Megalobrama amblycephala TaxID=75352 RepID=UPI0020142D13|nr:probable ATP-dependent DNA helicase HFM1 isoform X2 [Megalobrama amblycephala]